MKKSGTEFGIEPESVNWKLPYMLKCHEFKNKRILVIHSYECAYMASINNSVVYVTNDKEKYKKFADNVVNSIQFGNDDSCLLIKSNQWLDLIEILNKEENMPKFDIAIMNPPYDGNLHLKILEKIIPVADKVINISPVQWLQNPFAIDNKNSDYNRFKNTILKYIKNISYLPLEKMAEIFNGIDVSGGIYTIDNEGGYDVNNIQSKFLNKLKSIKYEKIINHIETDKIDGWRVRCGGNSAGKKASTRQSAESVKLGKINYVHHILNRIYNNGYTKNGIFWSEDRLPGAGNKKKPIGTPIPSSIKFKTEKEALEFIKFTKLKIIQFLCLECSNNNISKDKLMPWFSNFNKTNKDLCKFFNVDGYIDDDHAEPGSEWETILNTMKEYV